MPQPLTVVVGTYLASIAQVDAHRAEHVAFLQGLCDAGRVLVAGRQDPPEGSVIVLRDVAPAAAHALLEADPYVAAGLVRYDVVATFGPGVRAAGLDDVL